MHSIKVVDESEWKGLDSRWTRKARRQWRARSRGPNAPVAGSMKSHQRLGWKKMPMDPWCGDGVQWSCWASAFEEGHIRGKIPIVYRTMCIYIYYYMILHVCVCMSPFFPFDSNFEVWYLPCWDKLMEGWPDFRTGERGTMRSAFDRTWHTETLISWSFICIGCNMNTLNQSTKYIEI